MSETAIGAKQFAVAMGLLGERFNRVVSAGLSSIYLEAFKVVNLTGDELVAGVKQAITECEFFPSPKQIIERARPRLDESVEGASVLTRMLSDPRVRQHDGAREVWGIAAISSLYGEAAALATIAVGGVRRLASLTEDSLPFVLKEFARAYASLVREQESRHASTVLIASAIQQRQIATGAKATRGSLERVGDVTPRALSAGAP